MDQNGVEKKSRWPAERVILPRPRCIPMPLTDWRETLSGIDGDRSYLISGGMSSVFQPLDVSINKPFKLLVRNKWNQWFVEGHKSVTSTEHHAPANASFTMSRCNYFMQILYVKPNHPLTSENTWEKKIRIKSCTEQKKNQKEKKKMKDTGSMTILVVMTS